MSRTQWRKLSIMTRRKMHLTWLRESRWFMVNYFNPRVFFWHISWFEEYATENLSCSFLARFLCCLTQFCFSCSSRCHWIHCAVPCLRLCCWDSLQRYRHRLSCLHLHESCWNKGQIRRYKVVNLLGNKNENLNFPLIWNFSELFFYRILI